MSIGETRVNDEVRPFAVKLLDRPGSDAKIELRLAPNLTNVNYDYMVSWLLRQPVSQAGARAWEIDPPEGIEYGGPGSLLFGWWFVLPWLLIDLKPDAQAFQRGIYESPEQ